MKKLPFVVQPRSKPVLVDIGTEDTGIFKIERRGYLNVAEKTFVDNFTQSSENIRKIVDLATKVGIAKRLPREEAYEMLMSIMSGKELDKTTKDIYASFSDEIADLTTSLAETQNKRSLAVAFVLLQSRVDTEWTLDDTLGLDPIIIDQLNILYDEEEAKQQPEQVENVETAEETLGK
jgi:hypothetical protein